MKFVIVRFCFVTKITHLLHVYDTHEAKVYKRIFTLPCFNKLQKRKKQRQEQEKKSKQNNQINKQQLEKNLNI